jgi:electron transport complex protein RnfD
MVFEPPGLVVSSSPHVHAGLTTGRMMRAVMLALVPACLAGVYLFGLPALRVLVICTATAVAAEAGWQRLAGQTVTVGDGSAALTGILLALNLPPACPWWLALVGALTAIVVGKQVFGGLGHNPFNPALVARIVLLVSFPVAMTGWTAPQPGHLLPDAVSAATPLGAAKTAVTLTGRLPEGLMDTAGHYFWGCMSGSLGEVSAAALLAGGLFLLAVRVISWHVPASYLATVMLLSGLFWLVDPTRYPSPLFHLLTGGLLLGAFFMATDLVTTPLTGAGMVLFGCGCGVLTVLIRLFGGYPEGVAFSILLMNAATPLIDRYMTPRPFGLARGQSRWSGGAP